MTQSWLIALVLACTPRGEDGPGPKTDEMDTDTDTDTDTAEDSDTDATDSDTESTGSTADTSDPDTDTTSTGDTGIWHVPNPPDACEVTAVASTNPGPLVDAATLFRARIQGNELMRCSTGIGLGDNDGNGSAEFAVACFGDTTTYQEKEAEVWIFDGSQTGILHDTDAETVVRNTSYGTQHLAVGELTTTAPRSLVVALDYWLSDITAIDLPAPSGSWTLPEVAAASVLAPASYSGFPLGVGDVDGDGVHDLAIGSIVPNVLPMAVNGGVSIYKGPLVGTLDPLADAWAWYEVTAVDVPAGNFYYSGMFASSIVGDLDGDGVADILLPGERLADVAPSLYGPNDAAYQPHGGAVLFGRASAGGHSFADARSLLYASCHGWVGDRQTAVGDVTGDGWPDVAFSAPGADIDGEDQRGAIFVVSNLASSQGYTSMAAASSAILIGESGGDSLGPVGRLGDLNGDGVDDLVASAWWADDNGRAYVFLGPVSGTIHVADADLVLHGGRHDVRFGYSVQGIGDVDGDGVPDLMVGAQASDWGGVADAGAMYVFSGAALLSAM